MKVYQKLASLIQARLNCEKSGNGGWFERHTEEIEKILENYLPHGSGFDAGTRIDLDASNGEKLVLLTDYHHMDENGFYDGWSEDVKIVVTPSLQFGFTLKITGIRRKNRYDLDYWYDTFNAALSQEVKQSCL